MGQIWRFLPAGMTFVMLAVLLSLGNWQVQRLGWKRELLQTIETRLASDARDVRTAADIAGLTKAKDEYKRAKLYGRFGDMAPHFWFAQIVDPLPATAPADKVGYHDIRPFFLIDGTPVLVDRGFVPQRLRQAEPPLDAQARRVIEVVIRWPQARTAFDPPDQPADRLWYARDPKLIGAAMRLNVPPFLFEATRDPGATDARDPNIYPLGGQTRVKLSNNHLQYAVTWFGSALILAIISVLWHIRAFRPRPEESAD